MLITYKPYLRKSKATATHGTLYIRVTYNRKHIYLNVREAVPVECWNTKKGIVKNNLPGYELLNELIANEAYQARKKITTQRLAGQCLDFESIKALLTRKETGLPLDALFTEYAESVAMSKARKKQMKVTQNHFAKCGFPSDITEITQKHITDLREYLQKTCKKNTVITNLKRLKTVFNYAVKKGHLQKSPLTFIKIGAEETKITFLTEKELSKIDMVKETLSTELQQIAGAFLFACYTGFRFSDLMAITQSSLEKTEHGNAVLFTANKTNKQSFLPLIPLAEKYFCNVVGLNITNQYYNRALKTIAEKCEIDKPLTSHIARHTFATIGTAKGIKVEVMQSLLQHGNIKTTMGYAHLMEKTKWEELAKWKD